MSVTGLPAWMMMLLLLFFLPALAEHQGRSKDAVSWGIFDDIEDAISLGDSSSSSAGLFDEFDIDDEPFIVVRDMIAESRSLVTGILRGTVPEQIMKLAKAKQPKLARFFEGVSRSTRLCLRKYRPGTERLRNASKCFVEAVKAKQANEEEEGDEEVSKVQECLQDAMVEGAMDAAPLLADAQEQYLRFRAVVTETGRKMMMCRETVQPFDCIRTVWMEAVGTMADIRDHAMEMMMTAREIYTKYVDHMTYCMTPVAEPDPEGEEEDVVDYEEEEDNKKKDKAKVTTDGTRCDGANVYDAVDEVRGRPKPCDGI